ncbi:MAG: hypothetical protein HY909_02805 [Deltaproteobacteria bacterium]|nr:hypothetical protein [Deltaproteobacteria bacterium]
MEARGSLLVVTWSALACASAAPCGPSRACGLPSLVPAPGATMESRVALAWADRAAGQGRDLSGRDALGVGRRRVYLGFQVPTEALEGRLERALLVLVPDPGWSPSGARGSVRVRAVLTPWTAESTAPGAEPSLGGEVLAEARLPADARAVVRLEVTPALLAWRAGTGGTGDLCLEADGDGVSFVGVGALDPAERPRLEVQYR